MRKDRGKYFYMLKRQNNCGCGFCINCDAGNCFFASAPPLVIICEVCKKS